MIGQPPFIATEQQREQVRVYSAHLTDDMISSALGISHATLRKHFRAELDVGRRELLFDVSQLVATQARAGCTNSQRMIMQRYGLLKSRVELTGKDGGPVEHTEVDLSRLTDEQLEEYGKLAAITGGYDPDALTIVDGSVSPRKGET